MEISLRLLSFRTKNAKNDACDEKKVPPTATFSMHCLMEVTNCRSCRLGNQWQIALLIDLRNHEGRKLRFLGGHRRNAKAGQVSVCHPLWDFLWLETEIPGAWCLRTSMFGLGTGCLPVKFVGHHLLLDRKGGGQAGGFTHGDGVSSDSIAGMSDEISADASSCH